MRRTSRNIVCLLRGVPASVAEGIQDFQAVSQQVNVAKARRQHGLYAAALRRNPAVAAVVELPAADDEPDSVFVEDVLVYAKQRLVTTRPARASRLREVASLLKQPSFHSMLKEYIINFVHSELATAAEKDQLAGVCLEGGDVLQIGNVTFLGQSTRTNAAGARYLDTMLGTVVVPVPVPASTLHLKSMVTWAGPQLGFVVVDSAEGRQVLQDMEAGLQRAVAASHSTSTEQPVPAIDFGRRICVPDALGSNVLQVGSTVYWHGGSSAGSRAIFQQLAQQLPPGLTLEPLDMSELAKIDGALTCCSVIMQLEAVTNRLEDHWKDFESWERKYVGPG